MKQHTILLVACLMTVPAVTAEGSDGCEETADGWRCSGSVTMGSGGNSQQSADGGCQAVTYDVLITVLPRPSVNVRPDCVLP